MRVIVQPFFMDAAPNGITAISAASTVVASARRARDGAILSVVVFVARLLLLRVRIVASLCRTRGAFGFMAANMFFWACCSRTRADFRRLVEELQECFTGGSPIGYRCNWLSNREPWHASDRAS